MIKPGKKYYEWKKAKKELILKYRNNDILFCEYPNCNSTYNLSFHHLDKRSSGKAEHTFEGTRLVCQEHHFLCEYNKKYNKIVKGVR